VLVMRKSKPKLEIGEPVARLSDDEALRVSMARTRAAGERIEPAAALAPSVPADPELAALEAAVAARPQDLERHLSLLRMHHARGNAIGYEAAAQEMRQHVGSTTDPRWREAVVLGASLMPGHALFSPAGWNSPRYTDPLLPATATAATSERAVADANVRVFEHPAGEQASHLDEHPDLRELDLDEHAAGFAATTFGERDPQMLVEDEASSTRIELAKAYLDIGDLDGARSMLEEVLAEGGPSARAEAGRLLKDIG
jgi:pilus assembly protein FimV